MGIRFDLNGFDRLQNMVNGARNSIDDEVERTVVKVGMKFLRGVKLLSPVDTGQLRRSWTLTKEARAVLISNNTEYGIFINYGHRTRGGGYVEGRYMVEKTMETIREEFGNEIQQTVENLFE